MSTTQISETPWLEQTAQGWILRIRLQPAARRTRVIGEHGDQIKIAIMSPPVDGKANEALLRWLADQLQLPKSAVTLVSGQTSRSKRVALEAVRELNVTRILQALTPHA